MTKTFLDRLQWYAKSVEQRSVEVTECMKTRIEQRLMGQVFGTSSSQYLRTIWNKSELRYSFDVSRVSVQSALQQPSREKATVLTFERGMRPVGGKTRVSPSNISKHLSPLEA